MLWLGAVKRKERKEELASNVILTQYVSLLYKAINIIPQSVWWHVTTGWFITLFDLVLVHVSCCIFRSAAAEGHCPVKQHEIYLHFHRNTPSVQLNEAPQRLLGWNTCFGKHSNTPAKCLKALWTKEEEKSNSLAAECCVKVKTYCSNLGGRIKCHQVAFEKLFIKLKVKHCD